MSILSAGEPLDLCVNPQFLVQRLQKAELATELIHQRQHWVRLYHKDFHCRSAGAGLGHHRIAVAPRD